MYISIPIDLLNVCHATYFGPTITVRRVTLIVSSWLIVVFSVPLYIQNRMPNTKIKIYIHIARYSESVIIFFYISARTYMKVQRNHFWGDICKQISTYYVRVCTICWRMCIILRPYLPELKASHPHQSTKRPMTAFTGEPRGSGSFPVS
jgi:hypothetical protein